MCCFFHRKYMPTGRLFFHRQIGDLKIKNRQNCCSSLEPTKRQIIIALLIYPQDKSLVRLGTCTRHANLGEQQIVSHDRRVGLENQLRYPCLKLSSLNLGSGFFGFACKLEKKNLGSLSVVGKSVWYSTPVELSQDA